MNRMIKKKPRQSNQEGEEETKQEPGEATQDHTVIGEQGDELLYISKRQLKEQIDRSQLLSTLLYQSEISLSGDEQNQIREIIQR